MTDCTIRLKDQPARSHISGPVRFSKRGWLVRHLAGLSHDSVLIIELSDIHFHGAHLNALPIQFPAVHTARHAAIDAVSEISLPAVAAGKSGIALGSL